jgi:hypothetical protein
MDRKAPSVPHRHWWGHSCPVASAMLDMYRQAPNRALLSPVTPRYPLMTNLGSNIPRTVQFPAWNSPMAAQ